MQGYDEVRAIQIIRDTLGVGWVLTKGQVNFFCFVIFKVWLLCFWTLKSHFWKQDKALKTLFSNLFLIHFGFIYEDICLVAIFIVISNKIKFKILIFPNFEIFLILKIPNDLVIFKFPLSCSHSQLVLTPTCSLSHFHLIFPCISWPLFMRPKHFPLTCSLPHSPFFSHFISFSCKIKTKVSILRALEEAPNHTKCSWRRSSVFRDS